MLENKEYKYIPGTLKLTASLHLKMDGWNTIVSSWEGLFSGANCYIVSGRVYISIYIYIYDIFCFM